MYSPREIDLGIPSGEKSPVGARYFQLAVLIMAREIDQQYEWSSHEPAGRRQGLEQNGHRCRQVQQGYGGTIRQGCDPDHFRANTVS